MVPSDSGTSNNTTQTSLVKVDVLITDHASPVEVSYFKEAHCVRITSFNRAWSAINAYSMLINGIFKYFAYKAISAGVQVDEPRKSRDFAHQY